MKIDELDLRILKELQIDCTVPLSDLAERVGSSKSVCWRRIQQHLESGVIRERVAVLDGKKLGLGVTVLVDVKMEHQGENISEKFLKEIQAFPEVVECHLISGSISFQLKVVVRDVEDFQRFMSNNLAKVRHVREVSSYFSMDKFIDTTRLPLDNVILE